MPLKVESTVTTGLRCGNAPVAFLYSTQAVYVNFDLPGKVHAAVGGPGRFASCPTSISADNASV